MGKITCEFTSCKEANVLKTLKEGTHCTARSARSKAYLRQPRTMSSVTVCCVLRDPG
jgi:hypothetical protein